MTDEAREELGKQLRIFGDQCTDFEGMAAVVEAHADHLAGLERREELARRLG